MSKSQKRVRQALEACALNADVLEMQSDTRTAQQAADAAGCAVDQIAKSIILRGDTSGKAVLFLTAGGNQVDADKAQQVAGETLSKADAAFVRAQTGFAIGGVSPIGHLTVPRCFMDPKLLDFPLIWAAAGTPRHIFSASPDELREKIGAQLSDFTT